MHLDPLISFDPNGVQGPSTSIMNISEASPISSPGLMSPSTAKSQVDSRIFQFPPASHIPEMITPVKQEDWAEVMSPQETPTATFPAGPPPVHSSQGSPMAISPAISTLNTPRGSITSMRSQQSPMNTETHLQPEASFEAAPTFVSYTTVSHQNFPSPPGSPLVSSTTTNFGMPLPPPIYEDAYTTQIVDLMPSAAASIFMKGEEVPSPPLFSNHGSVMTTYGSTPDPSESFVSSDTCPETPDSSVKEEPELNSPETGTYICLWQDCHEEFVSRKALVDHIGDNHMGAQKGCEEFPCLWKVILTKFH